MHQTGNTLGGVYGFVAVYPDATVRTEFDFLWDELPMDKPIKALRLVDSVNDIIMFELTGYQTYFFSNEAVSAWQANPRIGALGTLYIPAPEDNLLTGKIFGAFNVSQGAIEIYVDMTRPVPVAHQHKYSVSTCPFAPHACRPGVVG